MIFLPFYQRYTIKILNLTVILFIFKMPFYGCMTAIMYKLLYIRYKNRSFLYTTLETMFNSLISWYSCPQLSRYDTVSLKTKLIGVISFLIHISNHIFIICLWLSMKISSSCNINLFNWLPLILNYSISKIPFRTSKKVLSKRYCS